MKNRYTFKKGERVSPATEFKKGHIPWNVRNPEAYSEKLKSPKAQRMKLSQFKKGDRPHNWKPVGTIVFRVHANKKGYCYIKTNEPNIWEQYHRVLWKKEHGERPKGHMVIFKNGDQKDCRLDNLKLITMAENAQRNKNYDSDGYVASTMARKGGRQGGYIDPELKKELLKQPELIELKRQELNLRRAINEQSRRRD